MIRLYVLLVVTAICLGIAGNEDYKAARVASGEVTLAAR